MKNEKLIKIVGIILIILTVALLTITLVININNKSKKDNVNNNINQTEDVSFDNNIQDTSNEIDYEATDYEPENLIGTLKIPKLNIEAEIMEGTDDSVLASYIGHFQNTSIWNGNVALASHNRGKNVAHYFATINQLVEGDEIIYTTKVGERRYKVFSTRKISNTDWSITEETNENIITLMTCITGSPELRFCVQAREILN